MFVAWYCVLAAIVGGLVFRGRKKLAEKLARKPNISAHIPELLDILLVLIRAGHGPATAVAQLHYWAHKDLYKPLIQAHTQLLSGSRFADVIQTLQIETSKIIALKRQKGKCFYLRLCII